MRPPSTIIWFRQDLRLADNPALHAAAKRGAVLPVFIWSPQEEGDWPIGAASRWWLHFSLTALDKILRAIGSRLIIRIGDPLSELRKLIRETRATTVYWNRRYEPASIARDHEIKQALSRDGVQVEISNGSLLFEPESIKTKSGKPFQVFTPFWRTCLALPVAKALPAPKSLRTPVKWPNSKDIASLKLLPRIDWATRIRAAWTPGCEAASLQLKSFIHKKFPRYDLERNQLDGKCSSRLSPHLHFGEISPRQVWHAVRSRAAKCSDAAESFMAEIGWREFAYHLMEHFPESTHTPLRKEFNAFPWSNNRARLRRWQRGATGYPIVDAAMRQLWKTGWMPNRARMIVASFLTKDLLIPWQQGAKWFWDTLVDADLANNTLGWQWTAGCGADAAPFFRVFNPVSQAEKFDSQGNYIRQWVPELAKMPSPWIFQPWDAPTEALRTAGVILGKTYPRPIVDHAVARATALQAYRRTRKSRALG